MRAVALLAAILTLLVIHPPASAPAYDRLDIRTDRLKVQGDYLPFLLVEVGQPVTMHCEWVVDVVIRKSIWRADGKEWKFPVRIQVDNEPVGNFEGKLGPRTKIGMEDDSRYLGVVGTSGPATWVAKDPGDHQAFCVVNTPKAMSDLYPDNNSSPPVTIRVTPKEIGALKKMAALSIAPASSNKSCRPMLLADLGINMPKHFADPEFGPAEVPKRELLLFLRHSEAAGNYVNCRYESGNKDVHDYVVNVPCKGAVPVAGQQHMYSCKP